MPSTWWILIGMPLRKARQAPAGRAGPVLVAALGLIIGSAGCAASGSAGASGQQASPQPTSSASPGSGTRALSASYLAIAVPANHRLDHEMDGFREHRRHDLAVAESYLRAQAATERWFDRRLQRITFPPRIAAVARALVRANQRRVRLTELQARSSSIAKLLSFTSRHKAADAAVEAQVRVIRKALGLPPPAAS
jgi:hypothetical protein